MRLLLNINGSTLKPVVAQCAVLEDMGVFLFISEWVTIEVKYLHVVDFSSIYNVLLVQFKNNQIETIDTIHDYTLQLVYYKIKNYLLRNEIFY